MIVIGIIVVAFAGYAVGSLNHQTSSSTSTFNGVPVTMTEYVIRSVYESYNVTISGTCTNGPGGEFASFTTTTYIEPTNMTGYFNATITIVSSSTISTNVHTTTVSTTVNTGITSSALCPVFG